jgi:hypothetical protein
VGNHNELDQEQTFAGKSLTGLLGAAMARLRDPGMSKELDSDVIDEAGAAQSGGDP